MIVSPQAVAEALRDVVDESKVMKAHADGDWMFQEADQETVGVLVVPLPRVQSFEVPDEPVPVELGEAAVRDQYEVEVREEEGNGLRASTQLPFGARYQ